MWCAGRRVVEARAPRRARGGLHAGRQAGGRAQAEQKSYLRTLLATPRFYNLACEINLLMLLRDYLAACTSGRW